MTREHRLVALIAVVLIALTVIPYLIALANTPDGTLFSGHLLGLLDGFSYVAKTRLGLMGNWAFYIFYTTEPHDPVYLTFLPYMLPGQALRLFTDAGAPNTFTTLIVTFHGLRVVFGLALIVVVYR